MYRPYQPSANRVTSAMPRKRKSSARAKNDGIDPAASALLIAKAEALQGDLPGCHCYDEVKEPGRNSAKPCEHVLVRVADLLLEWSDKPEKIGPEVKPSKKPKQVKTPSGEKKINHLLSFELKQADQHVESEQEDLSDEELEELEQAIELLEQQKGERKKDDVPTLALSREARIAAYGDRYDRHKELWHPLDSVQRQRTRKSCPEGESGNDLRFGTMIIPVLSEDGKIRDEEVTVVQCEKGEIQILHDKRKHP